MTARYPQSDPNTSRAQSEEPQGSLPGTGPNPNATGATARGCYYETSPRFEGYEGGEGQIHSAGQEEAAQDTYPQPAGRVLDEQMEG